MSDLAQAVAALAASHGKLEFDARVSDYNNSLDLCVGEIADRRRYVAWRFPKGQNATEIAAGLRKLADLVEKQFPDLRTPELSPQPK